MFARAETGAGRVGIFCCKGALQIQQNGTRAEAAGEVRPPANRLQLQAEQGLRAGYGATGQFAGLAANPLQMQPEGMPGIAGGGPILVKPARATTSEGRLFGERR